VVVEKNKKNIFEMGRVLRSRAKRKKSPPPPPAPFIRPRLNYCTRYAPYLLGRFSDNTRGYFTSFVIRSKEKEEEE